MTYAEIIARSVRGNYFRHRGRRRPLIPRRNGEAVNVSVSLGNPPLPSGAIPDSATNPIPAADGAKP